MEYQPRVLIVEDDEVSLTIAELVLQKEGFLTATATNGEEAIEQVQKDKFDLILMDIEMPIMNGLEATPIIRSLDNGRNVPIIALTAHSTQEKAVEFTRVGINDYLIKPFDSNKFKQIAAKFLYLQ